MTVLHVSLLALSGVAGVAAVAAARRDSRVRPVAWYLWIVVVLDLLRLALSAAQPPTDDVRSGWGLAARHGEAGLYLASILALPALAVCVFSAPKYSRCNSNDSAKTMSTSGPNPVTMWLKITNYSWWSVAAAGLGLWLFVVVAYPELRGDDLLSLYYAVELGGLLVSLLYLRRWLFDSGRPAPSPAAGCAIALLAGSIATAALPWATGRTLLEVWSEVVAINACMTGAVLLQLLQVLIRRRSRA